MMRNEKRLFFLCQSRLLVLWLLVLPYEEERVRLLTAQ